MADVVGRLPVKGSTVLEVGCRDGAISRRLASVGARRVVGIGPDLPASLEEGRLRLIRAGATELEAAGDRFDLAVSLSVLECVPDPSAVLKAVHAVLRPGGVLYTRFSPIWTYATGHHYEPSNQDGPPVAIPLWAHLYWTAEDMEAFLEARYGRAPARKAADAIYRSDAINRLGFRDYTRVLAGTPFRQVESTPLVNPLFRPLLRTKRKLLPGYEEDDLLVSGFVALLRK